MKKRLLRFIFSSLIFFPVFKSNAQCCSLGGPVSGDASLGVTSAGKVRAYSIYKHVESSRYFEGDKLLSASVIPAEGLNVENSFFDYTGISIAWGLTKKTSIEAEGGYFISKTQNFINPSDAKVTPKIGTGASDFYLMTKYGIFKTEGSDLELTIGTGTKLPFGRQYESDGATKFNRDVRPGSGAYSVVGTFFLYKGFTDKKIKLFLTGRGEFNGWDDEQYRYGNIYILSLFSNYNASRFMSFILQFREEIKSRDHSPKYRDGIIETTGAHKLFFIPQVNFTIQRKWFLGMLYERPVYQFYNGKQLASTYGFAVTLSHEFQLKKQ